MKPFDYNKYLKNNPLLKESIEETLDEKITATGAKDYTFKDDKGKTRIVTAYDLEQAKAKVKGFYPKADLNTITLKKVHNEEITEAPNLQKIVSDLYSKLMSTKPYSQKVDDYLVDEIIETIIRKPFTTWDKLNDKELAKIAPFLQAVIKWVDSKKEFRGLDMEWDGTKIISSDDEEGEEISGAMIRGKK